MPLYEYECKKCGHRFEKIQLFSDPMLKKCPECGGKIEQMISAPAFQFKGSGWYVNDYAKTPANAAGGKSGTDSGHSDSAEIKSDAKPKTEGESKSKSDSDSKKTSSGSESGSKKAHSKK